MIMQLTNKVCMLQEIFQNHKSQILKSMECNFLTWAKISKIWFEALWKVVLVIITLFKLLKEHLCPKRLSYCKTHLKIMYFGLRLKLRVNLKNSTQKWNCFSFKTKFIEKNSSNLFSLFKTKEMRVRSFQILRILPPKILLFDN